jgi:hypothetical protein
MLEHFETLYLDSPQDRQEIIKRVALVRSAVNIVIEQVPPTDWYTPRYHGWSVAVMLAHLNWVDRLALFTLQAALLNIKPRVSMAAVDRMNDFTARWFAQRTVESSQRTTHKNIKRIEDFITYLPMHKLSKAVFYPPENEYLTVEKALQHYFIGHWAYHLHEMLAVDPIERPGRIP